MERPEAPTSATEILVEAVENIEPRGISFVVVFCFDKHGRPVGWLSNVGEHTQRLGLIEIGKVAMMQDKDD